MTHEKTGWDFLATAMNPIVDEIGWLGGVGAARCFFHAGIEAALAQSSGLEATRIRSRGNAADIGLRKLCLRIAKHLGQDPLGCDTPIAGIELPTELRTMADRMDNDIAWVFATGLALADRAFEIAPAPRDCVADLIFIATETLGPVVDLVGKQKKTS